MNIEKLSETLQKRGSEYGCFIGMSDTSQKLKDITRESDFPPFQREALDLICTKIARLIHGNMNSRDSWHDICGYASLVVAELDRREIEDGK